MKLIPKNAINPKQVKNNSSNKFIDPDVFHRRSVETGLISLDIM